MSTDTPLLPSVALLRDNSLSDVVRHELERMILSGELEAGSRLNENAVAARLGVSRGPVREACRGLAELGLVQLIPNRGVFVKKMDRRDAEEVYDLRAGLTGLAGYLLAGRADEAQIAHLRGLLAQMDAVAAAGDFPAYYALNLAFHDYIAQATGNTRLLKAYRGLVNEFHLFRTHGLVQSGALTASNVEHRAMVDALERHDPQMAHETGFRHVANGKQRMLTALDQFAARGPLDTAAAGPLPLTDTAGEA